MERPQKVRIVIDPAFYAMFPKRKLRKKIVAFIMAHPKHASTGPSFKTDPKYTWISDEFKKRHQRTEGPGNDAGEEAEKQA